MGTLKGIVGMAVLWIYFKVAFAMGFGLLWSGGALILLAVIWIGLKKMMGTPTAKD